MRFSVGALIALMVALLLLGGLAEWLVDWRQIGPPSAAVSFEPTINGKSVTISGVTDLPDGTILDWELIRGTYARSEIATLISFDSVIVTGGRFTATTNGGPFRPGTILSVGVRFHPGIGQPAATVERFGPNGEHLRGAGVLDASGSPVLLVTRELVAP